VQCWIGCTLYKQVTQRILGPQPFATFGDCLDGGKGGDAREGRGNSCEQDHHLSLPSAFSPEQVVLPDAKQTCENLETAGVAAVLVGAKIRPEPFRPGMQRRRKARWRITLDNHWNDAACPTQACEVLDFRLDIPARRRLRRTQDDQMFGFAQRGPDLFDQRPAGREFRPIPEHLPDAPPEQPLYADAWRDVIRNPIRFQSSMYPCGGFLVGMRIADERGIAAWRIAC